MSMFSDTMAAVALRGECLCASVMLRKGEIPKWNDDAEFEDTTTKTRYSRTI